MATHANAGIVTTLFDASNEFEVNDSDQTTSVVNTNLLTNSDYNTRSFPIAGNQDVSPHESGLVQGTTTPLNHLFVQSEATDINTSINQSTSAYHEFSVQVSQDQLELDTLSFNYWATEALVNDPEGPTDFTYEVRALAAVNNAVGGTFSNLALTPNSGNNVIRLQNANNGTIFSSRNNVVEFDASSLGALDVGDTVTFRLAFADYGTDIGFGRGVGPDDSTHIHRLDNVQLEASPFLVAAVPEPSALSLLIGSFGLLGIRRRR